MCCKLVYIPPPPLCSDVKPENLLLDSNGRVKLTDFGLACEVRGPLYRVCGTPTYVAPEILSEGGYGCEVDLWSLGVIMHILLCGYAPFRSTDRDKLFALIKQGALSLQEPIWDTVQPGTVAQRVYDNSTIFECLRTAQVQSV